VTLTVTDTVSSVKNSQKFQVKQQIYGKMSPSWISSCKTAHSVILVISIRSITPRNKDCGINNNRKRISAFRP